MFLRRSWLGFLFLFIFFSVCYVPGTAQSDTVACTALVNLALSQFAENCGDVSANTACYGYNRTESSSLEGQPAVLSRPGDRIPLQNLKRIHTSPANPSLGQWGIALLNVEVVGNAPVPHTSARLLLLGDVALENSALPPQPSWQSFNFRTGFEQTICEQAPSVFAIQTADTAANLWVNNVHLQTTALAIFQWHSANNMTATVQSGQLQIENGPTAQTGQTLVGVMDNNGQVLFWSSPRPASDKELQIGQQAVDAFSRIGGHSSSAAPADIPSPVIVDTPIATEACGTSVTHVVEPGETLFRISVRYGTSVDAIVAANNILNRDQINPGQELGIPCGVGSAITPSSLPIESSTPPAAPVVISTLPGTIDCSGGLPSGLPPNLQYILGQFCATQQP